MIIPSKQTNLLMSGYPQQPKTHRNVIPTPFLAPMFLTPYTRTKKQDFFLIVHLLLHFKIQTFTFSLYYWFSVKNEIERFLPKSQLFVRLESFCTYLRPVELWVWITRFFHRKSRLISDCLTSLGQNRKHNMTNPSC